MAKDDQSVYNYNVNLKDTAPHTPSVLSPPITITEPSPDELRKSQQQRALRRSKTVEKEDRPMPSQEAFVRSEKKKQSAVKMWNVPNTPLKSINGAVSPWSPSVPIFEELKRNFPQNEKGKWKELKNTRTSTIYTAKELRESGNNKRQTYILKHLNPQFLARTDQQEDAILEYVNAKRLGSHPNLVQYYNHWWAGSSILFQIEYCPLGSLEDYLKQHPLKGKSREKKLFWNFFLDLVLGLHYIHKKGFLHLDIKPGNIFLVPTSNSKIPRLKIGDFGLLRHRKSTGRLKEGDGNYISPELLNSDSPDDIDDKADIYSLGVTLYEMATNFTLDRIVWQQIRDGELVLDHMTDELSALLLRMLSSDPSKRPTTLEILRSCTRLRKTAASLKVALPSESNDHLASEANTIDETPNSAEGNSTNEDEAAENRENSDDVEEVIQLNKAEVPETPSRSFATPTEMANVKRKLF